MYSVNFWHQLHLRSNKIVRVALVVLVTFLSVFTAEGQAPGKTHLPNFDEQKWHYGFLIGLHSSKYRTWYDDLYVDENLDSLFMVEPKSNMGFKVGFVIDYHIFDLLDVRMNPTVSFNQYQLDYIMSTSEVVTDLQDPTYVELPIMLKYKSIRRGNRRMYLLAGINPMFKAESSKQRDDPTEKFKSRNFNLAVEIGGGFDLYKEYFKFSPEVRYSFGLIDVINPKVNNSFNAPLNKVKMHTVSFYLSFEGGPSSFQRKGKKQKSRGFR